MKYKKLSPAEEIKVLKRVLIFISHIVCTVEASPPDALEYIKSELKDVGTWQYEIEQTERTEEKETKPEKKELF